MNIGTYAVTTAIGYANFDSGSHAAVIRVYDEESNMIGERRQASECKER
jgi:hypothetical protein